MTSSSTTQVVDYRRSFSFIRRRRPISNKRSLYPEIMNHSLDVNDDENDVVDDIDRRNTISSTNYECNLFLVDSTTPHQTQSLLPSSLSSLPSPSSRRKKESLSNNITINNNTAQTSFASAATIEDALRDFEDAFDDDDDKDHEEEDENEEEEEEEVKYHTTKPPKNDDVAFGICMSPHDAVRDTKDDDVIFKNSNPSFQPIGRIHRCKHKKPLYPKSNSLKFLDDEQEQDTSFEITTALDSKQRQEEQDLELARGLQKEEEENMLAHTKEEDERTRLVQMLLEAATEKAAQQRNKSSQQQQQQEIPPRVVEYLAPNEIPEALPPFSLVPESIFDESAGGGDDTKDACAICFDPLSSETAVVLRVCGHIFHLDCIDGALDHSKVCPQCRKSIRQDPQGVSPSGAMSITRRRHGNTKKKAVIQIEYNIPDGYQKQFHDKRGGRFRGCKKIAYIPDTTEGRKLLERLVYAFRHGLTFKIVNNPNDPTTEKDIVDWATIPHMGSVVDEKDDMQFLHFVSCQEELDQLGVPRR